MVKTWAVFLLKSVTCAYGERKRDREIDTYIHLGHFSDSLMGTLHRNENL
jgi:hypothetical protein